MRIVLDTNVLVSALHAPLGHPARVLRLLLDGRLELCVDARIVDEYRDVLARGKWSFETGRALDVLSFLLDAALFVTPPALPLALPDAEDAPFVEVASATNGVIVTGNRRHFPANAVGNVRVVTPREFLEALGSGELDLPYVTPS